MKAYYTLTSGINNSPLHLDMLRVSLKSLTENTSLVPYILYDGKESDTAYQIFQQYNAHVILCTCSFADKLQLYYQNTSQDVHGGIARMLGCFMKFDISLYEQQDEVVLYTDIDTLFLKDADWDSFQVKTLAAAPEFNQQYDIIKGYRYFSAGIMLINIPEARKRREQLFHMLDKRIPPYQECWDQGFWNELYKNDFETWPLEYNWKPYWGINEDAVIIHIHGFKLGSLNPNDLPLVHDLLCRFPGSYAGWMYYTQQAYKVLGEDRSQYITQLSLFLQPFQDPQWNLRSLLDYYLYRKLRSKSLTGYWAQKYQRIVNRLKSRHILPPQEGLSYERLFRK